jgi:tetratricopeptide (TPR) repeat protein
MPALIAAAGGDRTAAHQLLPDVAALRARLEREPQNPTLWAELGRIEAFAGNAAEALRCVNKAVELYPITLDAAGARYYERQRAFVYAWTGDKDHAIAEYARLLQTPYGGLNIHVMKRSPVYFPIRNEPRFAALLNDPKNKQPTF